MNDTARRIDEGAATQEVGTVASREGDLFVVRVGGGTRRARRAAGCLLCPAEGDLVLVASTRAGAWVLSVLERDGDAPARLELEGDIALAAPSGRLSVAARDGVAVATAAPLAVVAGEVNLHAPAGTVAVERLSFLGGAVHVDVASAKVVAVAVEQVAERVTQRAKRVVRFVEEFEELHAGRIDYAARSVLSLRGRLTALTAEALAKVNGKQVHIG